MPDQQQYLTMSQLPGAGGQQGACDVAAQMRQPGLLVVVAVLLLLAGAAAQHQLVEPIPHWMQESSCQLRTGCMHLQDHSLCAELTA